jgi:hypothetical protein
VYKHSIIVDKKNVSSVLSDLAAKGFKPDHEAKANTMSRFQFINKLERIPVDERVGSYRVFKDGECIHDEHH